MHWVLSSVNQGLLGLLHLSEPWPAPCLAAGQTLCSCSTHSRHCRSQLACLAAPCLLRRNRLRRGAWRSRAADRQLLGQVLASLAPTTVRLLAETRLFALVGAADQGGAAAAPPPDAALLFAHARFLRFGAVHHPHLLLGGAQPPGELPRCSLDLRVGARAWAHRSLLLTSCAWSRACPRVLPAWCVSHRREGLRALGKAIVWEVLSSLP